MNIKLVYLNVNVPQDSGYNYGLGYIAAVLKQRGHRVEYVILNNGRDVEEFYRKSRKEQPEMICFSAVSTQFCHLKEITRQLKTTKSFLVCGGIHTTLRPDSISEIEELDAVIVGEGEYPMLELAEAIENGGMIYDIGNVWFRKDGKIIKNPVRPLIKNLDKLPFPDKCSLDFQKLIDEAGGELRVIFSRGCPFDCAYCSNKTLSMVYPDKNHYFRHLSPERAIEQLKDDEKKFHFKRVVFDDDTISLNKEWFMEFFGVYKENFTYPFECNVRAGTVDEEMIRLLKEAGAEIVRFGVEHGNEKFRREILKKDITNKEIIELAGLCNKYMLNHFEFVMTGFPYETKELFFDTVRLCRKLNTESNIDIFHPYPGTPLGEVCIENGWLPKKDIFREREEAVIDYPDFSAKDIQRCRDMFQTLVRKKWISLKSPFRINFAIFLLLMLFSRLNALSNPYTNLVKYIDRRGGQLGLIVERNVPQIYRHVNKEAMKKRMSAIKRNK